MSDDVTIPRDQAQQLADFLLRNGLGRHHHLVKLLDPPKPSLRDEVVSELGNTSWAGETADRVLAVVRKRIEAMPAWNGSHTAPDHKPDSPWLDKDDVLALLGGDDE